jgi:NAD(P)-dependent dehydrogenase (short-subunit alcohol dehydrogenase family)
MKHVPLSSEERQHCIDLMQRLAEDYRHSPLDERLNSLIVKLYREGKRRLGEQAAHQRKKLRNEDRALLASTQLVQMQSDHPLALPGADSSSGQAPPRLNTPEDCYVCKQPYHDVHFFYHFLCPTCAAYSYSMRSISSDLRGRTALVTGGRVKIGHQIVLRLLRDGAKVWVVTRFPNTAALRLAAEPDFVDWQDRIKVYGLDLRNVPAVEAFADYLYEVESGLDILIHNAAQTIQRPDGFYRELIAQEQRPVDQMALPVQKMVAERAGLQLLQLAGQTLSTPLPMPGPEGILPVDRDHDREERVDQRDINSWLLPMEDVSSRELLEVQLVNAVAPFILNARLKSLMMRSSHQRRFIVNVSAMEGQFSRHKTIYHPHTNMAKASLNMMTHTSAAGYAKDGIYMNSVDTGWVTDENPTPKRHRKQEELGFFAPLDITDGMARVYHPIAHGVTLPQEPIWGQFLKDFQPCKW